ncbi:YecA/YgfB family protein [[Erwinia] mediterraneensis]|uniref:YecA/YgfB family protein n=1 Tax=[Erwinia] mediterraneensis TaxID=2161819 RepID=UPI001030CAF9|nr:YecA family protein [[Erwinia] mediterraneensis]
MQQGPLTEKELEWLEETLIKYGNDNSVVDVAELDGMLTALLSGPTQVEPSEWLVALWGGQQHIPKWASERERDRFINLTFQHMNDIADRLSDYPDQFEPVFGIRELEGQEFTVVEEWCFGYMRGVALSDWSALPADVQPALEAIALHGKEENFAALDQLSPEAFEESIEAIRPAALQLYDYWSAQPQVVPQPQQPVIAEPKTGRNDPCPCGSGKKFKQCCLH